MDRITVIGSRSLLRSGLVSLLSTIGFESIDEADDIKHLGVSLHTKPAADMLIVCLVQAFEEMIGTIGGIKDWEASARIVFVVPALDVDAMSWCFAEGAYGYLIDSISGDALRESLKLVRAGEKVFPSELASLFPILTSRTSNQEAGKLAPLETDLSRREIEILRCLTNGQSNKVIAKNLEIAEATVKVHVKRILKKARVVNRTQAALWGVAKGVVAPTIRKITG